jgi:hypothetical protein
MNARPQGIVAVVGHWINAIAGLWGDGVALVYIWTQLGEPSMDQLWTRGLGPGNWGAAMLGVQMLIYFAAIITGAVGILGRPFGRLWALILGVLGIVLVVLSLVVDMTAGYFILPAALGVLVANILLFAASYRS